MKRAVIYARVSTDEQAEKGYSLQSQIEAMREYAARNGMKVVCELRDDYSGAKLDRPALDQLRGMIKRKEADAVIVYAADRLSRNLAHLLILREEFNRAGIELHYVNRGKSEDTAESRLMENIEGVIAEFEREKIKERTRRGKLQKVKNGKWINVGYVPYGFRQVGRKEEARLEIDEAQAAVVRRMVDLLLGRNGCAPMTMKGLAKRLMAEGLPTPKPGRGWWTASIRRILKSTAIVGVFDFAGVTLEFPHLALIDRETYDAVQIALERNRQLIPRGRKYEYLFSGFAKCTCGGGLCGRRQFHGGYDYYYYICQRHCAQAHLIYCKERGVNVEILEPLVWNWLVELLTVDAKLEKGLREHSERREGELAKTRKELEMTNELIHRVEQKMIRLAKDIDDMESDESREELKALLDARGKEKQSLLKERERLTAELEQREITEADCEYIRAKAAIIRDQINGGLTYEEKRVMFRMLDLKIELRHNKDNDKERELFVTCGLASEGTPLVLKPRLNSTAHSSFYSGKIPLSTSSSTG